MTLPKRRSLIKSSRTTPYKSPSVSSRIRPRVTPTAGPSKSLLLTPCKNSAVSNVRVAVRVRPENGKESSVGHRIVKCVDSRILVFDPKEERNDFYFHGVKQRNRDVNKKEQKDQTFVFDNVYNPEATNADVYAGTMSDVIDTLFDGFNCSVFAYGSTGSGKTFTMLGNKEHDGMVFLTVQELYKRIQEMDSKHCEIEASYLEVYNETLRDLSNPNSTLSIMETGRNGVHVKGVSIHRPKHPMELVNILHHGNKNRTQHATDHNAESSRSHAIFQVTLKVREKASTVVKNWKVAKLSLIDLAGSERGTATGYTGSRFREGININKSLLALGNVISALADGKSHIPFRNSKLTHLLKDSIGGNCKTILIAAVSPSSLSYEDTYKTLGYASRAKNIKLSLSQNKEAVEVHITEYMKVIEELKEQLEKEKNKHTNLEEELKKKDAIIKKMEEKDSENKEAVKEDGFDTHLVSGATAKFEKSAKEPIASLPVVETSKENRQTCESVGKLRRQLLSCEMEIYATEERIDNCVQRTSHLNALDVLTNMEQKTTERVSRQLKQSKLFLERAKVRKERLLEEITEKTKGLDLSDPIFLREDCKLAQHVTEQIYQLLAKQKREEKAMANLMNGMVKTLKDQFLLLRAFKVATKDVELNFRNAILGAEGSKVSWQDEVSRQNVGELNNFFTSIKSKLFFVLDHSPDDFQKKSEVYKESMGVGKRAPLPCATFVNKTQNALKEITNLSPVQELSRENSQQMSSDQISVSGVFDKTFSLQQKENPRIQSTVTADTVVESFKVPGIVVTSSKVPSTAMDNLKLSDVITDRLNVPVAGCSKSPVTAELGPSSTASPFQSTFSGARKALNLYSSPSDRIKPLDLSMKCTSTPESQNCHNVSLIPVEDFSFNELVSEPVGTPLVCSRKFDSVKAKITSTPNCLAHFGSLDGTFEEIQAISPINFAVADMLSKTSNSHHDVDQSEEPVKELLETFVSKPEEGMEAALDDSNRCSAENHKSRSYTIPRTDLPAMNTSYTKPVTLNASYTVSDNQPPEGCAAPEQHTLDSTFTASDERGEETKEFAEKDTSNRMACTNFPVTKPILGPACLNTTFNRDISLPTSESGFKIPSSEKENASEGAATAKQSYHKRGQTKMPFSKPGAVRKEKSQRPFTTNSKARPVKF